MDNTSAQDKKMIIDQALQYAFANSEFGAANYKHIIFLAARHGVSAEDVEQYIAVQVAQGKYKHLQSGRNYYLISTT